MPGNVATASPSTVLPAFAGGGFREIRAFELIQNQYRAGERQTNARTTIPRRVFELSIRATAAQLATLRTFYNDNFSRAFYVYNPWETSPKFSHDPTGAATAGRYTVRFDGELTDVIGPARSEIQVRLIEAG